MTAQISKDDLVKFLDFLRAKGLMKRATVVSRKAAVNTLLSILSPEEAMDVGSIDVDSLIHRFHNLKGGEFKPASLRVYKSRLTSVLDDYRQYKADPLGFKPMASARDRAPTPTAEQGGTDKKERRGHEQAEQEQQREAESFGYRADSVETIVFPIPLRKGVIVRVAGIPNDLTPEEAEKIGNVVLALSGSQEKN